MNRACRGLLNHCLLIGTLAFLAGACSRPASEPSRTEEAQHEAEPKGHDEHAEGEGEKGHDEHGHEGESEHEEGVVELSPEAHTRSGIKLAAVESRALPAELLTTGQVGFNEDRLAHVGARVAGRLTEVRASLGQRVSRGETLAVLDSTDLGQARASYEQARAREDLTRQIAERETRLAAEKISSEQEALTAKAAHLEAQAELRRAEQTLRLMGVAAKDIEAMNNSSLSPVSSPFAGLVVEKEASLGEMVTPEQRLFTVADLSRLWIWIDVFEQDLRGVHVDDDVFVQVDAYPDDSFVGKVSFLASKVDAATRTVRARIDVSNNDARLRPGMFARVRLSDPHVAPSGAPAVLVPETALQRQGEGFVVFVPDGERRYRRQNVEVGRRVGPWVEILGGVEPGQQVVITGAFLLVSEAAKETMGAGHSH